MVNVSAVLQYLYNVANMSTGQTVAVEPGGAMNLAIKVGDRLKYIFSAWSPGTSVQLKMNVNGVITNIGSPITIGSDGRYETVEYPVVTVYSTSTPTFAVGGGITSGTVNLIGTPDALAILQTNAFPTTPKVNIDTGFSLVAKNNGFGAGKLIIWVRNLTGNPGTVSIALTGNPPAVLSVGSQVLYITAANIAVGGLFDVSGGVKFSTKGEHTMRIAYGHVSATGVNIEDGYVDVG